MGKFLSAQKPIQANFKQSSHFSAAAKADGVYRHHAYPFCLPAECAVENLYVGIRNQAVEFFDRHEIKWHDGGKRHPSNHMCDSQVSCVNFLYPFANQSNALADLLRPVFPQIECMLPFEDENYVTFEWIGQHNYLGEKISKNKKRTRGANFTSADAAVLFLRKDGKCQAVLIEWKYCEAYFKTFVKYAPSGTDKSRIYAHLFYAEDCILNKRRLPGYDSLFYEPFYQLMRQQFLAHEMEKAHELCIDYASLLHIAPWHNQDFKRITSPDLKPLGETATDVWKSLVQGEGRFASVYTEDLFGKFCVERYPILTDWYAYILKRYAWVKEECQV